MRTTMATAALAILLASAIPQQTNAQIFVKGDATGANTGTSWTDAYTDLQDALATAVAGSEIWVASGTYTPSATDPLVRFNMRDSVSVYGGFAGAETQLMERDHVANITILSGEIGAPGLADNSQGIVRVHNLSSGRLEGFTIRDGNGFIGVGIYQTSSAFTYENLVITNNHARLGGGGVNSTGGSTYINVVFEANSAEWGGGLYGAGLYPTDCVFINNTAQRGGALYTSTHAHMTACEFYGNSAVTTGGAVFTGGLSTATDCIFEGNTSATGGGAIETEAMVVTNSVFSGNRATGGVGGGIYVDGWGASFPSSIINCVFRNNRSPLSEGGGVAAIEATVDIVNVTFQGNTARRGGAYYHRNSSTTIVNSIFWDDSATITADEIYNVTSTPTLSYCLIQGSGGSASWDPAVGTDGGNNIDADPLFVDAPNGDLHLSPTSPAIDTGNSAVSGLPTTDLDGNARLIGIAVDMGAYESLVHTGVSNRSPGRSAALDGVYPNPFNPRVTIDFFLPRAAPVRVSIYDVRGALVATVLDEMVAAGTGRASWNGRNGRGLPVASGVYFVRLTSRQDTSVRKIALVK